MFGSLAFGVKAARSLKASEMKTDFGHYRKSRGCKTTGSAVHTLRFRV